MTAPWGEAHRREALRRVFEVCATKVATNAGRAVGLVGFCDWHDTEDRFRQWLLNAFGGDAKGADREVRRLRDLAEGRLVRETGWIVVRDDGLRTVDFVTLSSARETVRKLRSAGRIGRVSRLTCIRRAP